MAFHSLLIVPRSRQSKIVWLTKTYAKLWAISDKTSYRKISRGLEAVRSVVWIIVPLRNLTGALAALSNFRAIDQFQIKISRPWVFVKSYNKTSGTLNPGLFCKEMLNVFRKPIKYFKKCTNFEECMPFLTSPTGKLHNIIIWNGDIWKLHYVCYNIRCVYLAINCEITPISSTNE